MHTHTHTHTQSRWREPHRHIPGCCRDRWIKSESLRSIQGHGTYCGGHATRACGHGKRTRKPTRRIDSVTIETIKVTISLFHFETVSLWRSCCKLDRARNPKHDASTPWWLRQLKCHNFTVSFSRTVRLRRSCSSCCKLVRARKTKHNSFRSFPYIWLYARIYLCIHRCVHTSTGHGYENMYLSYEKPPAASIHAY